jgi:hypothetical protein
MSHSESRGRGGYLGFCTLLPHMQWPGIQASRYVAVFQVLSVLSEMVSNQSAFDMPVKIRIRVVSLLPFHQVDRVVLSDTSRKQIAGKCRAISVWMFANASLGSYTKIGHSFRFQRKLRPIFSKLGICVTQVTPSCSIRS